MPLILEIGPAEIKAFTDRHGEMIKIARGPNGKPFQLCKSGARILQGTNGPILAEPPADPQERASLQIEWHEHMLVVAEKSFRALAEAVQGTGPNYTWNEKLHGPAPYAMDWFTKSQMSLTRMRAIVLEHREAIRSLRAEIDCLPANVEARRREEQARRAEEAEKMKVANQLTELAKISID